jgi:hypothetical protein
MSDTRAKVAPLAVNSRLEKFLTSVGHTRGGLVFALDATGSRQPTWDLAAKLTNEMFAAVTGLDVRLIYYLDFDRCVSSRWLSDPNELTRLMRSVTCRSGPTQIRKVLRHAREENMREKVDALVFIGDSVEEFPNDLYAAARALRDVPVFMFLEGNADGVAAIYAEIARLTGGAVARFDAGAAARLTDLLRAIAAFATGGVKALASQQTEAAKLLLTQVKH